jgi:hypothetical protein
MSGGLFDALQFNTGGYGGTQGGLLDMLRMFQQQQDVKPSAGFTYGASEFNPIDAAGQSQQQAAAIPQNAQPAQGQMPAQMPQQPEGPNRLMTGLEGFINNAHTGPIGAILGGIGGAVSGQSASANRNQTQQLLIQKGLDPGIAKMVTQNPELLKAVLPQIMGTAGQTDDIREYKFAKTEDPSLTFEKFMARKKSVTGEYGLTPIWGTGPDGKPAYIQPGKSGDARLATLPEGFNIARDPIKVDAVTHFILLDPQTRQPVGQVPKDIAGKEAAEEVGKARGQAQVNLPNVIANAEQTLSVIDSIKNDPNRERGTGVSSLFNTVPGTRGFDFAQKVEQLKGKTFLEAFQALKGGGAITEIEGKKAENAIARLNVAQSEGEFVKALDELRDVVVAGMGRARTRAGQAAPVAAPASDTGWTDLGGGVRIRERR